MEKFFILFTLLKVLSSCTNEVSDYYNENFILKIAANYPNPPYFYTTIRGNKTIVINGIDYHLVNTIAKNLNISYEFIHANYLWGNQVNGNWNGMIGQIINGSANMALGALSSNTEREKVVDFTIPYYYSDITFFTRLTKINSINAKSLLVKPYSKGVWLYLIFTVILSSIILKIFKQSFEKTFWIMIRSLLQKGTPSIPKSLRLFAITWILCGLILSTTYVAFIFLFMSQLIPRPGIESIEELAVAVKNNEYIPATSGGGSLFKQIKDIKSPPLNYIGESLIDINRVNKAMKLMLTNMSRLSYICPRILIKGRSDSFGSEFFNLPPKTDDTTFIVEQLTIALPKNFKLKKRINKLIRNIESSALLFHWERSSLREKSNFKNRTQDINIIREEDPTEGLALYTIKYIFYLLFFGLIFASFVLMCEMIAIKMSPFIERFLIRTLKMFKCNTSLIHKKYIFD